MPHQKQPTERATRVKHTTWTLTQDQRKTFLEALLNLPSPNLKLRQAYKRLQQTAAHPIRTASRKPRGRDRAGEPSRSTLKG